MTLPPHVAASLARFRASLVARFDGRLREATLFGSYARGEAHEESDVDVLIVIDDLTESERRDVMDLSWAADYADPDGEWAGLSPLPFSTADVARMRSLERRLWTEIARDGVPL